MTIQFNLLESLTIRNRKRLKRFIASLFRKEKKVLGDLQYIFCSDDYLLDINRRFLNHDYYTDIITFDLSEKGKGQSINAEIYISIDRVKDNAACLKVEFSEELLRVMFHGALHLLGNKDKTKLESLIMRELETKWIKSFKKPFSLK